MDEDPPVRPAAGVRAVVADTNAISGGNFNVPTVATLADRLAAQSIPLWIPTQVIWEWAAHAAGKVQAAVQETTRLRSAANHLSAAGIPGIDPPPALPEWTLGSTSEIAERLAGGFEVTLRGLDNVAIVPPDGDAAIAALRDQILGTGSGEVKKSVRTGASDSALVRDAVAYAAAYPRPGRLVFLSKDKADLVKTLDAIGYSPDQYEVAGSENDFFTTTMTLHGIAPPSPSPLPAPTPTPGQPPATTPETASESGPESEPELESPNGPDAAGVAQLVTAHMRDSLSTGPDDTWAGLITNFGTAEIASRDAFDRIGGRLDEVTGVELEGVTTLIGLRDVLIDELEPDTNSQPGSAYVSFTVIVLAAVAVYGYYLDQDGVTNMDQISFSEVLVEAPCAAQISLDGEDVIRIHQSDTASVEDAEVRFYDSDDALVWLLDYLESLDGVVVTRPEGDESSVVRITRGEEVFDAQIERDVDNGDGTSTEWTVYFDALVTVECNHDPASRMYDEGEHTFWWQPPYSLNSTVAQRFAQPYSAISEIWRKLTGT